MEQLLRGRLPSFAALGPAFVSVAGTASGGVLQILEEVSATHCIRPQLHLPRAECTEESAVALVDSALRVGVRDVLVLGSAPGSLRPASGGGFGSAAELVRFLRARYAERKLRISVCGFPRGASGEAGSYEGDLRELAAQTKAGASQVVCLPSFDAATHMQYVADARALGVEARVLPGLLPVLEAAEFRRICRALHVTPPAWLEARISEAAASSEPGAVHACGAGLLKQLAAELGQAGACAPHVYTLNSAAALDALLHAGYRPLQHRAGPAT